MSHFSGYHKLLNNEQYDAAKLCVNFIKLRHHISKLSSSIPKTLKNKTMQLASFLRPVNLDDSFIHSSAIIANNWLSSSLKILKEHHQFHLDFLSVQLEDFSFTEKEATAIANKALYWAANDIKFPYAFRQDTGQRLIDILSKQNSQPGILKQNLCFSSTACQTDESSIQDLSHSTSAGNFMDLPRPSIPTFNARTRRITRKKKVLRFRNSTLPKNFIFTSELTTATPPGISGPSRALSLPDVDKTVYIASAGESSIHAPPDIFSLSKDLCGTSINASTINDSTSASNVTPIFDITSLQDPPIRSPPNISNNSQLSARKRSKSSPPASNVPKRGLFDSHSLNTRCVKIHGDKRSKASLWSLSPTFASKIIIGDENLKFWPYDDSTFQVDIFPEVLIDHVREIIKKADCNPHIDLICFALGFYNKKQNPQASSLKSLSSLISSTKIKFPNARIIFPQIHFSENLPSGEKDNLSVLNDYLRTSNQFTSINCIDSTLFKVSSNNMWTPNTASLIFAKWFPVLKN